MSGTPYERFEGIKETIRLHLMLPARDMKYEVHDNPNDGTKLHTVYQSKPMKALELSTMTEGEVLKLKEFWDRACDDALATVRELDAAAHENLVKHGRPSKRLYRTGAKLLLFPEKGGAPDEWDPIMGSGNEA